MEQQQITIEQSDSNVIKMFFYTNNNNLRTYLSLDSLTSKESIETDIYNDSFGGLFNYGILLSTNFLSYDIVKQDEDESQNVYPVALQISFSKTTQNNIPIILVDKSYKARLSFLNEFDKSSHLFALFLGHIPFCYVEKIIFRDDIEKNSFYYPLSNIFYPRDMFEVLPNVFNGETIPDYKSLTESVNLVIHDFEVPLEDIVKTVHLRNRIKAIILSSMASFSMPLSYYSINADKILIENFLHDPLVFIEKKVNTIFPELNFTIDSFLKFRDKTAFPHLLSVLELLNGNESVLTKCKYIIDKKGISEIDRVEIIFYLVALNMLINQAWENKFERELWLEDFRVQIYEIFESLGIKDKFNELKYSNGLDVVKSAAIRGNVKIKEILAKTESSSKGLRALIMFLKNPMFTEFDTLQKDLDTFGLNPDEKRFIWTFFGALNGMAGLGSAYKKDLYINRIADTITLRITKNRYLISESCPLDLFKQSKIPIKGTLLTESGYPLRIVINYNDEKCREFLISQLNIKNKSKENITDKIINHILKSIDVPQKYLRFRYEFNVKENLSYELKPNVWILSTSKLTEPKKELDFEAYYKDILSNEQAFKLEFNRQPNLWLSLENEFRKELNSTVEVSKGGRATKTKADKNQ